MAIIQTFWARVIVFVVLFNSFSAWASVFTDVNYQTNEMGAASLNFPIEVPKGTGGIEPRLAIGYSSQAGNGVAGMGGQLQGLSTIHRCAKIYAIDGVRSGVRLTQDDGYCVDGKRLLKVSGTYGADQSEYRTAVDEFSRVVAYGSTGKGPQYFKLWTKDGRILSYGATAQARMEASDGTTVLEWALESVTDRNGNALSIQYQKDATVGELLPQQINYGGNSALNKPATVSVSFSYGSRTDKILSYVAGREMSISKILTAVTVNSGGSALRKYLLSYQTSSTTKRTLLNSVKQCNAAGDRCLQPVDLHWSSALTAPNTWEGGALNEGSLNPNWSYTNLLGDINNDGLPDLVMTSVITTGASAGTYAYTSTYSIAGNFGAVQGGQIDTYFADSDNTTLQGYAQTLTDVNGDGIPDLLFTRANWRGVWAYAFLGNGSGGWSARIGGKVSTDAFPNNETVPGVNVTDVNGDGRPDIVISEVLAAGIKVSSYLGNGDGTFATRVLTQVTTTDWRGDVLAMRWEDLDGDQGKDLLIVRGNGSGLQALTAIGRGDGGFNAATTVQLATGAWNYGWGFTTGDINGDGRVDIVVDKVSGGTPWYAYTFLSKGDGQYSAMKTSSLGSDFPSTSTMHLADVNGDGLLDLIYDSYTNTAGSSQHIAYSDGQGGFSALTPVKIGPTDYAVFYQLQKFNTDMDGDARDDSIYVFRSTIGSHYSAYVGRTNTGYADLLTSIDEAGQQTAQFNYTNLLSSSYTKAASTSYPNVWSWAPLKLVSSMSLSAPDGSTRRFDYSYTGLNANVTGYGMLGFATRNVKDVSKGLTETTQYNQAWPLTGLVASVTRSGSGVGNNGVLSKTTNSYSTVLLSGGSTFVGLTSAATSTWDINGTALPTQTVTRKFDCAAGVTTCYGNLTSEAWAASDGYSKTTTYTYQNTPSSWLIGLVSQKSVASTAP